MRHCFLLLATTAIALAGCRRDPAPVPAPVAPAAAATPAADPGSGAAAAAARKEAHAREGMYAGMKFPMARAAFITQLNTRLRDNCTRPDRHGRLCPKLEQRSAACSSVVKRAVVADADAAREVGGRYLRCLHRGHA